MIRRSIFILSLIVCVACGGKKNQFEDKTLLTIADLQDRREGDSLIHFLLSDNPKYRQAAALAFASVQDTSAIAALGKLSEPEAVFALGQTYNHGAVAALVSKLRDRSSTIQIEALEGLGKVIRKKELGIFADSMNAQGLAWGYYRAGLRGVFDSTSVYSAASILDDPAGSKMARLGVAHFFSRSQFKQTSDVATVLKAVAGDDDPDIRMAVVGALGKLKPDESIHAITIATNDPDYRTRVNSVRALRTQSWDVAKPLYEKLLSDSNVHVNVAAAEMLLSVANDTAALHAWAKAAKNWRTQATLYEALLKLSDKSDELKSIYNDAKDYQKAALLSALSQAYNADFIFDIFKKTQTKVIKSTAAMALARINRRDAKGSPKFIPIYQEIIKDGDQGAIIYVCGALRDTTLGFKKLITDYTFLEAAKAKLSLPRDYETYAPLEETLNYLKGLPPPAPLKNEFNHPIDWDLAATIAPDQHVLIKTSKGDIVMQLFIEEAPGSVVNFVKLVNDKYFDDKFFHRVVPNFVIQTGCNRGDGFGGEDYSIRSEFSQRKYKTGSVGMASAGKDTEGTQWFITHSPTPHLDGKYTIFAEVVKGMDVVHQIEVGDKIIEARLIKE